MAEHDRIDFGHVGVVDADGPVVYRRWGGPAGLTMVCLHGMTASSAAWAPVAGVLRRWGTVVAPDLPGFGRTPLCGRTGIAAQQRVVSRILDAAAAGDPVLLFAASMGAVVAVRQAVARPGRVGGLVIGSGYLPAYYGGWRAPATVAAMLAEQLGNLGRGARRSLLLPPLKARPPQQALVSEDDSVAPPGVPAPRPRDGMRAAARAALPMAAMAAFPPAARRLYGRVDCPVLVVHGAEDPLVPAAWAVRAAHRHDWELHLMPAVAHVVHLASPEWWLERVGRWLVDHDLADPDRVGAHGPEPSARR